jgi:lipopolysaccharide/colanic/teichoic acid biosynthesis glycosyltransferase
VNARFRALFTSEVGAIEASQTLTLVARRRVAPRALRVRELRVREYRAKRVIDFVLATGALVVSAPVWLAIAAAIKLEDRGPVFYVQPRWGLRQQPFCVYKFRSMIVDADRKFGAVQAGRNDPRFTRVGRLLRGTSLDELPQLLNIWRGEMSWVGPRALPINERQQNEITDLPDDAIPGFHERCSVRPGLTGIAQVFAPRDTPRRQKFRYDLFYIKRQSLWLDLKLIAASFWISLRLRWETRGRKI